MILIAMKRRLACYIFFDWIFIIFFPPYSRRRLSTKVLREHGDLHESRFLGEAEHEVHVLQRLAGGALDEVVDHADDDGPALDSVLEDSDEAVVAAPNVPRVRNLTLAKHVHEGLRLELLRKGRPQPLHRRPARKLDVNRALKRKRKQGSAFILGFSFHFNDA